MKKKRAKRKIDTVEKLAALTVAGFEDVHKEFDDVRNEIEGVRNEIGGVRNEIARNQDETREKLHEIRLELADIHRRIDHLEEQGARQAGYSKEIDYLLTRMSRIEKHLKMA